VTEFEAVIGLEIHVQLGTRTKLFCGDEARFGGPPNSRVCPVCLGLPGALPVLNGAAVELAVRAALGLECTVREQSRFARKSYFYPDLPKGYQITQYERPLAVGGRLLVPVPVTAAGARRDAPAGDSPDGLEVRIRRLHLEEDAGRSMHDRVRGATAIDLNRAGVPLMEIVTEPDLRSPAEARAFLERLRQTLRYLGVGDCDMEKGSLRVDANVSIRAREDTGLGPRTELKNLNTFSGVERALAHEIERQVGLVRAGHRVIAETLLWDADRSEARPLRSKEESRDYRYFPEPDLPPVRVGGDTVERIRGALPELPAARELRFAEQYGLPAYDVHVLTADAGVADYFEAVSAGADPKAASNWVMRDVLGWTAAQGADIGAFPIEPERLAGLVRRVSDGTISQTAARRVFEGMTTSGARADAVIEELGVAQVSDASTIGEWADAVIREYPAEADRFRAGEAQVLDFLMGQLMTRSGGRADPRRAAALLRTRLNE
jgi:aspartyl-tRNA(Asn)/glutamyl-tRNA(Gln) amidotransferase subunit B